MPGSLRVLRLALVAGAVGMAVAAVPAAAQTISSGANQTFVVNDPATTISAITITDAVTPVITAKNDIRVRIPAALNMTWDATVTTATISGTGSGKVSTTVSYANGNKDLVIDVTTNFTASNQIVVSGLKYTSFTATSSATNLGLITGGGGGAVVATDDKTIQIVTPTFVGAATQVFTVGDPATAMTTSTITDASAPRITAANDIRLRIPAALNMTWNTALTTATIGGGASGKVSTTVTYEDAGKTLVLNVTADFAASDQITVAGLQYNNFTAVSAATAVELVIAGSGGATIATSTTTKQIVQPTIASAANQSFLVGAAATNMSTITVTDNATSPSITAANDIRIRIPSGFNMTWNTALTTATIGGGASAKVSTTVSYEDAGRTLVLNVTSDFAVSNQITVSGLQFNNFTAISPVNNLQLVVSGSGGTTAATDSKTIQVYVPLAISSAGSQTFVVNDAATTASAITITDALTPTMTAANDIRVRIPAALNMTWDATVTTATITGTGSSKVSTTVSYASGNKDLVLNVTTNFASNDQIVVSGLKFTSFTAASSANNLGMITGGGAGAVVATDDKTMTIVAVTVTGTANQFFTVGDPATAMTATTVTDASIPKITAANDIRLRIPTGFNMTWNTSLTTATISGSGAGKVSTTVTYENSGQVLVVNVTSDFAANDAITISGLQYNNFTAVSAAAPLQLVLSGAAGGATFAVSDKNKQIVQPTIVSAANQSFLVGAAATNMSTITVTDNATSPSITAANDIRIRIPSGFNMTWNTALTTATIGGGASAKVSTTVSYEDAGRTLVLDVTSSFAASDQITVSGLQYQSFTAMSPANNLQLVVSGSGGGTVNTDTKTIQVTVPRSMSSAANQTFVVSDPSTTTATITITDGSPGTISTGGDIRVRIPAALNMTWDPTVTTATITGTGASKVSTTVSYANGNKDLFIDATANFAGNDQIVVSGLKFTSFTGTSAPNNLGLIVGGPGGAVVATDDKTITIIGPTLTGSANQVFTVGDPATAMTTSTVTEGTTAVITAANDIRLRIPAALNMTWNTSLTTATIGGGAAGKVSTTVTYEDAGKTLVLNVTSNFAANDQITVSGLQYTSFTATSAATAVELVVAGAGGATAGTSDKTKQIVQPTIVSAANQTFVVGQAATNMSTSTITDNATSPSITAANDIRIRIPSGFNMTWNTSLTTATIGGAAAAKVSTTVSYEDAGRTLVLNVTSNFAASDQVTVSGLQFNNFTAITAANNLQLVISGSGGGTADPDTRTIAIVAPTLSSAANQTFVVAQAATAMSTITITDANPASITAANDIRVRIPSSFNMTWNTAITTATIGGAAAAKVSTTVSYEDGGKTLVLNVITNFANSNQITVSGLQFTNFTTLSAADYLQLVVGGVGAGIATLDTKTITIVAPTLSSATNKTFGVGDPATTMATATVTDNATAATITAANDIRFRIPSGFNMTWNTALTTATIGGAAASKVSTTVSYENSGQVLVLNVTSNFAAGDQITVSGLQFNNFTATSAANYLQLVVSGAGGGSAATDDKTITISLFGVSVTPASTTASDLPSNGTNYTVAFTVQNTGGGTDNFDLLTVRNPGTTLTTVSMTGSGVTQGALPDSARLTGLGSGASTAVTVTYSVGNVAAGSIDTLKFTARSTGDPTKTALGKLTVTVIRPSMTTSRVRSPTGNQPPGTLITHTITITNTGTTDASTGIISDSVSSNLQFKLGSVVTNLPGMTAALEYSNDAGVSWAYTPVSAGCSAPAGYDGCVNRIRWRLLSSLSSTPPDNTGNVQFDSRIR